MTYPFEFFRALHRGTDGDVDFYRRVGVGARTLLELGAGDGRIARALAADGVRVTALEFSPEAIAAGRKAPGGEEVEWVLGSMERFELEGRFERIIAPYNAVYCLTSAAAQRACFESVARHLAPGGYFVFDVWSAEVFHAEAREEDGDGEPEKVDEISVGGVVYEVFESSTWDREAHFLDVVYTHRPVGGGAPVVAKIPQRYLLVEELTAMLEEQGLELVVIHGGFDQHVFVDEGERLVVTATLPT